jgi:hypothetical protein
MSQWLLWEHFQDGVEAFAFLTVRSLVPFYERASLSVNTIREAQKASLKEETRKPSLEDNLGEQPVSLCPFMSSPSMQSRLQSAYTVKTLCFDMHMIPGHIMM